MVASQLAGSILVGLLALSQASAPAPTPDAGPAPGPVWFAGDYFYGDGLGVNVRLTILEGGRFSFIWRGCLGVYDLNSGSVGERDGVLNLTFDRENSRGGFRGLSPTFVPVRWGQRLYLVEPDDLVAFCNEVNQGFEPRYQIHGRFLLRQGDENVSVGDARPELPESHRSYLLDNPIEARVVQVLGTKPVPSGVAGIEQGITTVVLDAGSRDGVRVGMELVCHEPGTFEEARVVEVGPRTSKAEVTRYIPTQPVPAVGWRMSTARPVSPQCDESEAGGDSEDE